jgi:metal-dependent amidase/aminoacylase/carboxypeptidase family protein
MPAPIDALTSLADTLVAHRRTFHMHPELGFEEEQTGYRILQHLTSLGLSPERMAGTGVVATVGGKHGGKTLLVRADMDALPLSEQSAAPTAHRTPAR